MNEMRHSTGAASGAAYIPTVGGTRGVFETLIPGVFLLLNLGFVMYIFQNRFLSSDSFLYEFLKNNNILTIIIIIVFGYLIGVVLWLCRADVPDKLSARLRKRFETKKRPLPEFFNDEFPYNDGLGRIVEDRLSGIAVSFYINCWRSHAEKNKYFFNYTKTLINSIDDCASVEVYAMEALIRYIAAMFYALMASLLLWGFVLISEINNIDILEDSSILIDSIVFIILYLLAICTLLWHFRYMRFKEVQVVFTASLLNSSEISKYLCSDRHDPQVVYER